jgi:hypothetical protein
MTEETKSWREVLNGLESQLVYFEAGARKKGSTAEFKAKQRHTAAALTCARDAVAKKLAKMMLFGEGVEAENG